MILLELLCGEKMHEKKKLFFVVVLCTLLFISYIGSFLMLSTVSGSQEVVAEEEHPWPCFGGNPQRTGQSFYNTEHVGGAIMWTFDTGGAYSSSPAIDRDGTIYVGSWGNYLFAVNPDGSEKWRYPTGGRVESSPTIGVDGTIYVGSDDSKLYAIDPDGTLKWEFRTEHVVESSPVIGVDGTIYIGADDGFLYAINPNGTLSWTYQLMNIYIKPWCSPAVGLDGTIYIGSSNSKLYAINPNGTLDWIFDTDSAMASLVSTAAIGTDGTIYVGYSDNNLYAINPDGTLKWSFKTKDTIRSSPAIDSDGTIYVGSWDNRLYAIDPDGTLKWSYRTGGWVASPAIGADGTIYFVSSDDIIHALNPDGTLRWNFRAKGIGETSPAIGSDGTVYIHCTNGLCAFGGGRGTQVKESESELFLLSIISGAGVVFGAALLLAKQSMNKTNPYYQQLHRTDESETLLSEIKKSADIKYVALGIVSIAIGLFLFYYVPFDIMYGYIDHPYRVIGISTLFLGVAISVIGVFIKKVRVKNLDIQIPDDYRVHSHDKESIQITTRYTADVRVIAIGILFVLFGFIIFLLNPLIVYGSPPNEPTPVEILILSGVIIAVVGLFIDKKEEIKSLPRPDDDYPPLGYTPRNYIKKPGMKRCPRCDEVAVVVEEDNSAFCEHCSHSTVDYSKWTDY